MARHYVSKKDAKTVLEKLNAVDIELGDSSEIEVDDRKDLKLYYKSKKAIGFEGSDGLFIPSLFVLNSTMPTGWFITVDDGAIPHLMNGADLFAQGIVDMDMKITEDHMVFIRNKKGVFFAVGKTVRSASEIMADKKGIAAKLLHYAQDSIYNIYAVQ
jgi:predicted RNA-binding protein (TIGR00451 family)